jgi:hypothetical protein
MYNAAYFLYGLNIQALQVLHNHFANGGWYKHPHITHIPSSISFLSFGVSLIIPYRISAILVDPQSGHFSGFVS